MKAKAIVLLLSVMFLSTAVLASDDDRQAQSADKARRIESGQQVSRAETVEPDQIERSSMRPQGGARADVPRVIGFQGTLMDDQGVALDTTVAMTFSIYTDSVSGTQVWTETQPAVLVGGGLFNVLLGSVNGIADSVFSDPVRWLGVQVGGDPELAPRQRMAAVGYACWAAEADTAQYARNALGGSDGDWTVAGSDLYAAVSGKVGIGTTTPAAKLDVAGAVSADSVYQIEHQTVLSVEGLDNVFVGTGAGENATGSQSTFVGSRAGEDDQGGYNVFVGSGAGYENTTGAGNIFIGNVAGGSNTTGQLNTFIGQAAGRNNTEGDENVCVGDKAGYFNITGSKNTFLGTSAGYNAEGDSNVFIGYWAGSQEPGSNKLYIANGSDTSDVLIYGEFATGRVGLGTLDPQARLDVAGTINADSLYMMHGDAVLSTAGYGNTMVGIGAGGNNSGSLVTFLGDSSGHDNQGQQNVFLGPKAGYMNTTGGLNTFVGSYAGYNNSTLGANTFIGGRAGYGSTGSGNTFIGTGAGADSSSSGSDNVFVGLSSGKRNTTGSQNSFLGTGSGRSNSAGYHNTCLGWNTGADNTTGYFNTLVGSGSGGSNIDGNNNTCVGANSGYYNDAGDANVFLGYRAGYWETGSNKLYIANDQDTSDVLIYGDFGIGRVGLGTLDPQARLDVQGTLNVGINGAGHDVNFYGFGSGSRFFWDEDKMSLRAGTDQDGTHWDPDSVGTYSMAIGYNTKASGTNGATALGYQSVASGDRGAVASGYATIASGDYGATALGFETTASGDYGATAAGHVTTAVGNYGATALGYQSVASGDRGATAMGFTTVASGHRGATALGHMTRASGDSGSIAIGSLVKAGPANHTIVLGSGAGGDTLVNNVPRSLMVGFNSTTPTLFVNSSSVGVGTTAPNGELHVQSTTNIHSGSNFANRIAPLVVGDGDGSGACLLIDDNQIEQANTAGQLLNLNYNSSSDVTLCIGGGDVGIGTDSPDARLHVDGAVRLGAGTRDFQIQEVDSSDPEGWSGLIDYGGIGIGSNDGANRQMVMVTDGSGSYNIFTVATSENSGSTWEADLVVQQNGRVGVGTGSPSRTLFVNGDAGGTTDWYNDSDGRLKRNVETIPDALEKVRRLRGVNFEWRDTEHHPSGRQMGFIAQEAADVIPEVVSDRDDRYAMQYGPITALLVEAVKELQAENQALRERLETLEAASR